MKCLRLPVAVACGLALAALAGPAPAADDAKPTAESVVRKSADFYKKVKSLSVDVERSQKLGPISSTVTLRAAFERPNRMAVHVVQPGGGVDAVSDGLSLFIAVAPLKKYTEGKAPASLDEIASDPVLMGLLQFSMLPELSANDPYAKLMEGVTKTSYEGKEAVGGVQTHHLKFVQEQFDWEMWVNAEGDPLVRRVTVDLTKMVANSPGAAQFKGQKLEMVQDFQHWKVNGDLGKSVFAFHPPDGFKKVENFMADAGDGGGEPEEEAPSPLLGKPAPAIELKTLTGKGEFRLADEAKKNKVTMVDFWATWCGPCVMELPILADVAMTYKDKGLLFYAVNLRETPDEIKKFLKEKKLDFNVALDTDGKVADSYKVEGIPTLALIDGKGVVQSIHIGYNPQIKQTLSKEIDALLAGKDLAKETLEKAKKDRPKATEKPAGEKPGDEAKKGELDLKDLKVSAGPAPAAKDEGLESAWSAQGAFLGVAVGAKGRPIYGVEANGRCEVVDAVGKSLRVINLPARGVGVARAVRLPKGAEGLLTYASWGNAAVVSRTDGTKVWEQTGGQGIDDARPADLDGDGVDEVIVGYNGNTGLHAFAADGHRLWKRTDLGNVWHVTAADLDGDGKPEVVSTSAEGKVHLTAPADGKPLRDVEPGLYGNMIRTVPAGVTAGTKADSVLVGGMSTGGGLALAAVAGDGKVRWTLDLGAAVPSADSLEVSPDGRWAAVGVRGGRVHVVDTATGKVVAQRGGHGQLPQVAWAASGEGDRTEPLLLVATGSGLNAYRVRPAGTLAATPR